MSIAVAESVVDPEKFIFTVVEVHDEATRRVWPPKNHLYIHPGFPSEGHSVVPNDLSDTCCVFAPILGTDTPKPDPESRV